ncbi:MAG: LysR family transcriptional regulator [Kofleriaceae bacterium]|nr:LysR family transcriptional regulator [Kofleriaceae bacterium]
MDFLARAQTFLRVVETGSLSAAARSQRASLPAVSRQISSLERELGASLLLRTSRRLQLTEAGERFREHARELVRAAEAARTSVDRRAGLAGRMVLSTSVTLGTLRVVPSLADLSAAHPHLELELRLEDRVADLVGEGVDVALRAGLDLPDTTSIIATPIAQFRQHVVTSTRYLRGKRRPRTVADLAMHAAVLGLGSRTTWDFSGDRRVTAATSLRIGTLVGIASAVEAGLGIAILPEFVADAYALVRLDLDAELPTVNVHALFRTEVRGSPRVAALVDHLRHSVPLRRVG